MRLAKLSLFGFKSFADKLEIGFQTGITGIVGPNGCGKSNISDAIRWVLGEQSAKLLRGNRMDDLIFSGNGRRQPLGMAEVSLTFTDNAGDIPTEFSEVTITRRLYRSGESEYLLNHTPCRLRDITDLFLDTGLGGEPYALIEQGTIGNIVSAKPSERRLLIEEAAGVMAYKVRKKAALAKLELAEQNLVRLNDIIHEVERQRNSLKRQANKAERHRAYQDRVRELKAFLRFHERQHLQQQLCAAEESEQTATREVDGVHVTLVTLEAEQEAIRLAELEQERARAAAQERLQEARTCLSRDEAELSHLQQMLSDLGILQEERRYRLAGLMARRTTLADEGSELQQQVRSRLQEIEAQRHQLDHKSSALRSMEESITGELSILDAQKRRIVQEAAGLAERRNHLSSLRERERVYARQRELATDRRDALSQQESDLSALERDQQRLLDRVVQELADLRAQREELVRQALAEETARETLKSELDTLKENSHRVMSRLSSLIELSERFEGYADGHQYLLRQKGEGNPGLEGIRGSLAELIAAPARYERAIEALLGDALQGLVVRRRDEAWRAIQLLNERGHGRATFLLPPENGHGLRGTAAPLRETVAALDLSDLGGGVLEGLAVDLIQCDEADRPLLEALLGEGIIVKDLDAAVGLAGRFPPPFMIATLDGEMVSSRGIVAGGPGGGVGILGRRREIAELQELSRQQSHSLRVVEEAWEASHGRSAQLAESLELLDRRARESETDHLKAEKELSVTRGERRRVLQQVEVLTYESKSHSEDLRVLAEEILGFESMLLGDEERHRLAALEAARIEEIVASRQEERNRIIHEVGEVRVQLTSLQGQHELLAQALSGIEQEIDRQGTEIESLEGEFAQAETKRTLMEATVIELQHRLSALVEQEQVAQEAVTERQASCRALAEKRALLDERVQALRRSLEQAQQALTAATIRRAEARTALLHFEAALAEAGLGEVETIAGRISEGGLGVEEGRSELADLNTKITELGGVNPAALDEYQELAERHRFLSTQAGDLRASAKTLHATIAEINTTIEERFNETLRAVNNHLDRLWKHLFSGGEATLALVEVEPGEEEPGLEMLVRVPGKRASLNLLSGGEKALAALALLLALFHTRPSPFCLLDEVDAPLDDANIERFAALLKQMAATAQFIVITHNRRTMEVADMLYGVTMQERGVSTLLSVRMNQAA